MEGLTEWLAEGGYAQRRADTTRTVAEVNAYLGPIDQRGEGSAHWRRIRKADRTVLKIVRAGGNPGNGWRLGHGRLHGSTASDYTRRISRPAEVQAIGRLAAAKRVADILGEWA